MSCLKYKEAGCFEMEVKSIEIPLTEEQQMLVAENHNLIYAYAHSHRLNLDEVYGILAIALCVAARNFVEEKGYTFSTYAFHGMDYQMIKYWDSVHAQKRIPQDGVCSLNTKIYGEDRSSADYMEFLDSYFFATHIDESRPYVQEFLCSLNPVETSVACGLIYGYSEKFIAKHLKCTQSNINLIKHLLRRKYLKFSGESDTKYLVSRRKGSHYRNACM